MGHVWELCRLVKSRWKCDDIRVLDALVDDNLRRGLLSSYYSKLAKPDLNVKMRFPRSHEKQQRVLITVRMHITEKERKRAASQSPSP
jgi:hypothetical protein